MEPSTLRAAYLDAVYGAIIDGRPVEFSFSRSRFAPGSAPFTGLPGPWAIVSATNPMSRILSENENRDRTGRLVNILNRSSLPSFPAWGRSHSGDWREQSLLIPGCEPGLALSLAEDFNQMAVVWSTGSQTGLLFRQSGSWAVRAVHSAVIRGLPAPHDS